MLIDDEPTIRMLLGRILELEGYEVLKAKDRISALDVLKKEKVQVVLCDVFLPDGNGVDMVPELQRLAPEAKIILLTAHGNIYNPQIQKSGETKTKGSKSDKNWAESQFQAVIEI